MINSRIYSTLKKYKPQTTCYVIIPLGPSVVRCNNGTTSGSGISNDCVTLSLSFMFFRNIAFLRTMGVPSGDPFSSPDGWPSLFLDVGECRKIVRDNWLPIFAFWHFMCSSCAEILRLCTSAASFSQYVRISPLPWNETENQFLSYCKSSIKPPGGLLEKGGLLKN